MMAIFFFQLCVMEKKVSMMHDMYFPPWTPLQPCTGSGNHC